MSGVLKSKYVNMAEIGHKFEVVRPITIVCPLLKGSAFETFKWTNIHLGELLGMNVKSFMVR